MSSPRGRDLDVDATIGRATIHPSFLLRMPDRGRAEQEFTAFVDDLKVAAAD
jgi:DNA polymerase